MWNTNICLTSKGSIKVILLIACSILLLAFGYSNLPREEVFPLVEDQPWIPTQEDLDYQDSMYSIIEQTQLEVDTIKFAIDDILYKLDRLYYDDGSWDSIRYVAGGRIDKSLIKEEL